MSDAPKKVAALVVLLLVAGVLGLRAYGQYQDVVVSENLFLEGERAAHDRDFKKAVDAYAASYTRNPQYFPAYEAAADIEYGSFRDTRKAIEVLELARQRVPDDVRVLKKLGEYYFRAQLPEFRGKAVETLELAAKADPQDRSVAGLLTKARAAVESAR